MWPKFRIAPTMMILICAIVFAKTYTSALAAEPTAEQQLQVERQLGCPICTNVPLNVCDNQICQQMKGVIHQKLTDGESPDQIVDYFVARYGEGVLLTPPSSGFSLAVWYGPILALVVGGVLIWVLLRGSLRRQRLIQDRLTTTDVDLDDYRRRVRREVDRLGESS
jgi:cytochrome c-type biogenesis protein CcmH